MKKSLILGLIIFLWSTKSFCEQSTLCEKCLTQQEYNEIILHLEQLSKVNKQLATQLEKIQTQPPQLDLEPIEIVIDNQGRVFIKDKVKGTLQIADLNYKLDVKIKTVVVKSNKNQYGFGIKFKAVGIMNYEKNADKLETYSTGALGLETFYYDSFNFNIIGSPRLLGLAVGIDVTNHFDLLIGMGSTNEKDPKRSPFIGGAFDF